MTEHRNLVRAVRVRWICDECGGEFRFIDVIQPTSPPKFKHKCNGCEATESSFEQYPKVEFEDE